MGYISRARSIFSLEILYDNISQYITRLQDNTINHKIGLSTPGVHPGGEMYPLEITRYHKMSQDITSKIYKKWQDK